MTLAVNLAAIIDDHPAEAVALVSRGKVTTYGELRAQVAGFRGGLVGLGLRPGDRLALLCANNWYFVVSYLAGLSAGLIVVPLNPLSPARELQRRAGGDRRPGGGRRALGPRLVRPGRRRPGSRPSSTSSTAARSPAAPTCCWTRSWRRTRCRRWSATPTTSPC